MSVQILFELEQRLARVGWSKPEIVEAISQEPASDRKLEDFRVRELSSSICLATYRTGSSLRSSIWRRIGDAWQMVFHQGTALMLLLAIALLPVDARAETYVAELSCTKGPYRLRLPKSYKALRGLGHLRRERVGKTEEHGTHTVTHRELRFNGLELDVVTSSDKPGEYTVSSAVLSSANWKVGGQLRVGTSARVALKGMGSKNLPRDGEVEFNGDKDSIRVNLARGRVLDVEYSCSND